MTSDTPRLDLRDPSLYRHWATETLRYCDTDQQGHINNIAFAVFCETGRVHFMMGSGDNGQLNPPGTFLAIVRLALDYISEIHWPGEARIGTGVLSVGRSSFTLGQGIFVADRCVASAESVIVLADSATRRSTPLAGDIRRHVEAGLLVR